MSTARTTATKHDEGKPQLHLLPPTYWFAKYQEAGEKEDLVRAELNGYTAMHLIAGWFWGGSPLEHARSWLRECHGDPLLGLVHGAEKYGLWNWLRGGGFAYSRLTSAALRHCYKHALGVVIDADTGIDHIDLALSNLEMLAWYEDSNYGIDDRPNVL